MFFKFISAVVTRSLFILVSLIGVWRVVWVKNNELYWCLTILYLPLVAEMILTLKRRRGNDYKWFSPAIFLFLISIVPSLWILELHHQDNKSADSTCQKLDSTENIKSLFKFWTNSTNGSDPRGGWITREVVRELVKYKHCLTVSSEEEEEVEDLTMMVIMQGQQRELPLSKVCANDWILALHQIVLILLILGKWLMPAAGDLTRDKLSQLLLIFVGTAADILEFTSETLYDMNSDNGQAMVYVIMATWTWSMLQFPLHLSVMDGSPDDSLDNAPSLFSQLSSEIWSAVEALLIQDGPFLLVRLIVMIYFNVVHQMLIFFAIKNVLVVILNIYRLSVLICDKSS